MRLPSPSPIALPVALLVLATAFAGCLDGDQPDVLATFYPITFLVEGVAGDAVSVDQILRPGTEPHDWEPSVRDVGRIAAAQVVFAQGLEFEPWLERTLTGLGRDAPVVVWTAERIGALPELDHDDHEDDHHEDDHHENDHHENDHHENDHHDGDHDHDHDHGDVDPHTWLDPVLMARKVAVVEAALVAAFPEHAETFRANALALVDRLDALHGAYTERLAECATRHIVVQHDAFAYLAARYHFTVHAASGIHPDAEPNAPRVAALIDEAREHNVSVVFAENAARPGVMRTIAGAIGGEVRVLSPIEWRTSEEAAAGLDYIGIMERNLDQLAAAMGCSA